MTAVRARRLWTRRACVGPEHQCGNRSRDWSGGGKLYAEGDGNDASYKASEAGGSRQQFPVHVTLPLESVQIVLDTAGS